MQTSREEYRPGGSAHDRSKLSGMASCYGRSIVPLDDTYRPAPIYPSLGEGFADVVEPARFPRHTLRFRNQRWAERVGLGSLEAAEWERAFASFEPLRDNLPAPLALRYHGHQFDVYNPQLGDGRGFLFAQLRDDRERVIDLGTKGSGRTPWSRGGDGRLTLKGGVREVLASEMLEALGVDTSKSLSLFETGESLIRGDEPSPTRSSVLVRASHSHIRFGTFQRLLAHDDTARIRTLLDYTLANYFPGVTGPIGFLREVCARAASLVASWMVAGFVHGVLNSDNMNVTGESFDYGPYRFLPHYDPTFVAAYFDHSGLYAYGRQPDAVFRNLYRLARCLEPLATNCSPRWPCSSRDSRAKCGGDFSRDSASSRSPTTRTSPRSKHRSRSSRAARSDGTDSSSTGTAARRVHDAPTRRPRRSRFAAPRSRQSAGESRCTHRAM